MTTKETTLFCARQIECILRYVQSVYPKQQGKLESDLSMCIVVLEELSKSES